MTLDEITSKAQLLEKIEEGDEELLEDIRHEVRAEGNRQADDWNMISVDTEFFDTREEVDSLLARPDFKATEILQYAGIGDDLVDRLTNLVDESWLETEIRSEIQLIAQGHRGSWMHFEEESRSAQGYPVRETDMAYEVRLDDLPLAWVPEDLVEEILNAEVQPHYGDDITWESIGDRRWSSGWVPRGVSLHLVFDRGKAYEWAYDTLREYMSGMVDAEPEEAVATYERYLRREHPQLAKDLKKAKLPLDVRASLAVAFFENEEEGLLALTETLGYFGYEGSKAPVILELDRAALAAMGIRSGRWWDGAPWRLVDLPPEELAYEGTLQRHCVGRHDMGYRQAVERGEKKIWSLRSNADRPVLTWEVDAGEWWQASQWGDSPAAAQARGGAIRQLKGKLNRPAGKTWDEVRVLHWIFAKLGVDPGEVDDFVPPAPDSGRLDANDNPGFNSPWVPYGRRLLAVPNPWFGPRTCYRPR